MPGEVVLSPEGMAHFDDLRAKMDREASYRALLRRSLAMLDEWEWASREDATWAGACPSCSAPRNPTYTPGAPDADHAPDCQAEQLRRDLRAALGEGE